MKRNSNDYLQAAVEGASPVGLVVLLYDRLVADLTRAIAAMEKGEVESCVAQINHAFLVLGQLEGSLDSSQAPEAARTQTLFYQVARSRILEAHIKSNRKMLEEQIALFNDVRAAWEQVDRARHSTLPVPPPMPSLNNGDGEQLSALDATA
jgi:flagellar secretion chaperone FliS